MNVADFNAADFHFLRPLWLLALVPAAILAALAWRRMRAGRSDWARVVDPHLLPHLVAEGGGALARWPVPLLLAGWTAAILALAGPAWERVPAPAPDRIEPLVAAISVAPTMKQADESPSRIGAARYKAADALARMRGGEVGLIAYADVAFVAAPLTVDLKTVSALLPDVDADLIRALSSRPDLAITKAVDLLKGAGARSGRIVLFADGAGDEPDKTLSAARAAAGAGYEVSVIGLGTGPGRSGAASGDGEKLAAVANAGGGAFSPLTVDGRDLDAVLGGEGGLGPSLAPAAPQAGDAWVDMGPFLLVLAVILAPLAFRRGWVAVLLVALLPALGAPGAKAASLGLPQSWDDLWSRPDQQAAAAYARQDYARAAQLATDPAMKGAALYRAGDYDAAAAAFAKVPGGDYDRANALARAGRLEEALAAYDSALRSNPTDENARKNREVVERELELRKPLPDPPKPENNSAGGKGGDNGGDKGKGGGQGDAGSPPPPDGAQKDNPADDRRAGAEPPAAAPPADRSLPPPAPLPPRRPPELVRGPPPATPPDAPSPPPAAAAAPPPAQPQQPPAAENAPNEPPPEPLKEQKNMATAQAVPKSQGQPSIVRPPDPLKPPPTLAEDRLRREQLLRMVADDPGKLLAARITSYYSRVPLRMYEGK